MASASVVLGSTRVPRLPRPGAAAGGVALKDGDGRRRVKSPPKAYETLGRPAGTCCDLQDSCFCWAREGVGLGGACVGLPDGSALNLLPGRCGSPGSLEYLCRNSNSACPKLPGDALATSRYFPRACVELFRPFPSSLFRFLSLFIPQLRQEPSSAMGNIPSLAAVSNLHGSIDRHGGCSSPVTADECAWAHRWWTNW